MMEEVTSEEHEVVDDTKIVDELQEAALTNVTQAPPDTVRENTPPVSTMPPPSDLPPELTSSYPGLLAGEPVAPPTEGFVPSPLPSTAFAEAGYSPMDSSPEQPKIFTPDTSSIPAYQQYEPAVNPATETTPYVTQTCTSPASQSNTPSSSQYTSPPAMTGPHDMSSTVDMNQEDPTAAGPLYPTPSERGPRSGLFGWFSGGALVHKVMEKTKSSVETMITTLDPGMKEIIYSGGDVNIVVTSTKESKVGAVRDAFQKVFGKATVRGQESQPNIAPQPVGYSAGLKGAEERIANIKRSGQLPEQQVFVSAENFIVEMLPDKWYDICCMVLRDSINNISLEVFSQATPIPSDFVQQAHDVTPHDYPLRWSGLAITVGQVISRQMPQVDHANWHAHFTGVSRQELLFLCARQLAGLYKQRLPQVEVQH